METGVVRPLQKDAADYFYYAYNLRHHQTYSRQAYQPSGAHAQMTPDAVRHPGYPLFLSLLVDGPPGPGLIKKIQFWQMILSTLTVVAAGILFRCFMPPLWACASAALTAVSPHLIVFNSYVLTETLFCFMLICLGLLVCRLAGQPSIWLSILIGAVMALATLIRPSLQFFPVLMALLLWLAFGRQTGLKLFVYVCLGFLLILSPWYIRNFATLGKVSDKALMINFLHHGLYPDFKYQQKAHSYRRPYQFDPRSDIIKTGVASVTSEIIERFRQEPAAHLKWYLLGKPVKFWSWDTVQGHGDMYVYYVSSSPFKTRPLFQGIQKLMKFIHGPLALLAILVSLVLWLAPRIMAVNPTQLFMVRFISALLLYYTALHMVGAPFPRYSVPLRPFQFAMGLYALYVILTMKTNDTVSSTAGEP
jgi:4-amino-4-deoxy-L-arabinose transferase-like glycosyltransferase